MSEQLRERRMKLVSDQRQILKTADDAKRALTTDEMESFDKMNDAIDSLKHTIDRSEKVAAAEAELEQRITLAEPIETRTPETMSLAVSPQVMRGTASDEYRVGFENYIRGRLLNPDEQRALSEGTDSEGGYLVPDQWNDRIVLKLNEENVMRQLSTVIRTETGTFNIPVVSNSATAAWISEGGTITEADTVFANYTMAAYKAGRAMKVSRELLADQRFDLVSFITDDFVRSINTLAEAAYVDGSGSAPQGIIYNATVNSFAGATAITADEVIDLFHALKPQYRARASTAWLMADATIKLIRQLKDTTNQYLWQPGLRDGEPDRLLGKPVYASSHCPAAISGGKSVVFADFSYFWIGDRSGIEMQRVNELYAATGQVGFIGTFRTDSVLTNTEAAQVGQQA